MDSGNGCPHQNHTPCRTCIKEVITPMAQMGIIGHLLMTLICLFHFEFVGIFVEFSWAVERLFGIGDYAEGGWFDELGIKWRE